MDYEFNIIIVKTLHHALIQNGRNEKDTGICREYDHSLIFHFVT